jgi:hypothetical protein
MKNQNQEHANFKRAIQMLSLFVCILLPMQLLADDDDESGRSALDINRYQARLMLGVTHWNGLSDIDTGGNGSFDEYGFNLEFSVHGRVTEVFGRDLLVGADLGLWSHESDVFAVQEDLTVRGLYLTPSLRLVFGSPRSTRVNLETGAGLYMVDFTEIIDSGYYYVEGEEKFDSSALGGYVGVSADIPVNMWGTELDVSVATKVHFADFGEVEGLGPEPTNLNGPIFMLQAGVAF